MLRTFVLRLLRFRIDGRHVIGLLAVLFIVSTLQREFREDFNRPDAREGPPAHIVLPQPFDHSILAASINRQPQDEALPKLALSPVRVGRQSLYRNELGCLYGEYQLNQLEASADKYLEAMRSLTGQK